MRKGKAIVMFEAVAMGWLRLVASLKSYVSFAEYCLFYRALAVDYRKRGRVDDSDGAAIVWK